jgi:penicillin-binding protein 1B
MLDRGAIDEEAFQQASKAQIDLRAQAAPVRSVQYFVDHVAQQMRVRHASNGLGDGGLAVFTSLDMRLQRAAQEAVGAGLSELEGRYPLSGDGEESLQAALVALDPRSGEILAMVGGRDYGESQFNRAVNARRQPGSAFKPIVTLAALSRADLGIDDRLPFTLASVLEDEKLVVETPSGPWEPVNYDRRFRGRVSLRGALERSLNVPFARLGTLVGAQRIVETARKLGVGGPLNPVPSIALGSSEVTPLELTRAYGVIAAGGYRSELQPTLLVLDREGNVLHRSRRAGEQVYDPAEAYLVTSALRGAVERGTGRSLRALGYRGAVAAKSGTTNNFRDAWFIGYTPTLAVGVWVGFDDGRSIGLPGAIVALPIFARFLAAATGADGEEGSYGGARFVRPSGLEVVEIDPHTGLRAGPGCRGEPELFLPGTAPAKSCAPVWWVGQDWQGRVTVSREELGRIRAEVIRLLESRRRRGGGRRR